MSEDSKTVVSEMQSYVDEILDIPNCRYLSWEHCYNAFGNSKLDDDTLALHLGFYLASWGMYRGSCGLLQKDYKVHLKAVAIILNKKYQPIRFTENNILNTKNQESIIELILELKTELVNHYKSIEYTKGSSEIKFISATDTLITKIMLGTLGCVPALDRYFMDGIHLKEIAGYTLNKNLLERLFKFIEKHESEIKDVQIKLKDRKVYYPFMKIVDMYFWQLGYEKEQQGKKRK